MSNRGESSAREGCARPFIIDLRSDAHSSRARTMPATESYQDRQGSLRPGQPVETVVDDDDPPAVFRDGRANCSRG